MFNRPWSSQPYGMSMDNSSRFYNTHSSFKSSKFLPGRRRSPHSASRNHSNRKTMSRDNLRRTFPQRNRTLVFSAINDELKKNLKQSVPLYKDSMMGHVVYQETRSKIIRPSSSKPFYNANRTILDEAKQQKMKRFKSLLKKDHKMKLLQKKREASLDPHFFKTTNTYFNSKFPSILMPIQSQLRV